MARRDLLRAVLAGVAFVSTLTIAALNEHAPLDIKPGLPAQALAGIVPPIVAALAAWAVWRPWPAFLGILLLTPLWNVAQVSWWVGNVQVILQTLLLAWLWVGLGLLSGLRGRPRSIGRPFELVRANPGPSAAAVFLVLATLSTVVSPNVPQSFGVLLHGIYEPVAFGAFVLALRPNRRGLAELLVVLGLSVALGGLINMIQALPATGGSLYHLQVNRLLFSRLTYFNVGLFGEMLAMAAPLLLGALLLRRELGLGRRGVAVLVVALGVAVGALFLTFSKSAYLATAGGTLVFFLLLVRTWRARLGIVAASVLLSAFVVPWPAAALQFSPPLANAYRDVMVRLVGQSRYDSWDPAKLSGRGSLVERAYATEAALRMAADHPLLGVGLDQFGPEYQGPYKNPKAHFPADSAHTFWPEVAAELGMPALLAVLAIYLAALTALWRLYRSPPDGETRLLAVMLLAAGAAWIMVASAFAGDMYREWRNMSSDFVMMAVLVAAAFALSSIAARREEANSGAVAEEEDRAELAA